MSKYLQPVRRSDGKRFVSASEAARDISTREGKRFRTVLAGINIALDDPKRSAYGFRWERIEQWW